MSTESESPSTDAMEEADFHRYGDDDMVPITCYHRMTALSREMEASAKELGRLLGEAWKERDAALAREAAILEFCQS
jgi:hypothetical protein